MSTSKLSTSRFEAHPVSYSQPSRSKPVLTRLRILFCLLVSSVYLFRSYGLDYLYDIYDGMGDENQVDLESPDQWTEWTDIEPSEKLQWQPCFGIFDDDLQCARLTVPMDYHRPLNESKEHPKVHIALMMKPGGNRTHDPSSYAESPLIINPGGPGGSGVMTVALSGKNLQELAGRQHDIIGFDPRGVGATTPKADCFASADDPQGLDGRNIGFMNRMNWISTGHDVGIVNSSNVALGKLNTRARAVAKLCKRADEAYGDDSIFRYSNTPNVARDMLSIIHAWDEWRISADNGIKPVDEPETTDLPDRSKAGPEIDTVRSTKGKLVYWGFSYGTVIGATFASMFPDKVGRVILDGVVDVDHYVEPVWDDNLVDADAIWDKFFVYCADAGPNCDFSLLGDRPEDIKKRFNEVMRLLEKEPTIVLPHHVNLPILFTASDLKLIILLSLYSPIAAFPVIAFILKYLVEDRLDDIVFTTPSAMFCHDIKVAVWPDDAQQAISCSDKRYKLDEGVPELQKRFERLAEDSWFADIWMGLNPNLGCNGWEIEAKDPPMQWDDRPGNKSEPIETDFPLLFLSSQLDPVTPLHSALKMTRKFSEASIIEQKSEGHCTVSCFSPCTLGYIRAYLNEGIVPPAPKFGSDDEGEWPTCTCKDKPWKSVKQYGPSSNPQGDHGWQVSEDTKGQEDNQDLEIMKAHDAVRAHLLANAVSQHIGAHNPLRHLLVDPSTYDLTKPKTCGST